MNLFDNQVVRIAAGLGPSARGEPEIADVNNAYVAEGRAAIEILGRGFAWLDTGTPSSLLDASHFVATLQRRQGMSIACLEDFAYRAGFIDKDQLRALARRSGESDYGGYLLRILEEAQPR